MNDDYTSLYIELRETETTIKDLERHRADLLAQLAPRGNAEFDFGDKHIVAQVITRETPVVNLIKLEEREPLLFSQVTKRVLDTNKFNKSLDAKLWPQDLLEEVVTVNTSRPYIKFAEYHLGEDPQP